MTTPDPRTDLAGYLGLTDERAARCHKAPVGTVFVDVVARLIEQDQARADEPDDGLIPVAGVTEEMHDAHDRAFTAELMKAGDLSAAGRAGIQAVLDLISVPEPVEGPPGTVPVTLWLTAQEVSGEGESWDTAFDKLCDACAAIDLPAPLPPWKSPLDDLPDLTEAQCDEAVSRELQRPGHFPPDAIYRQIGRALIAAGWTPEGEA